MIRCFFVHTPGRSLPAGLASLLLASIAMALLSIACSQSLTTGKAEKALRESPLLQGGAALEVIAVSQEAGRNEAIVKARIDGIPLNLKFRKYDQGWSWEFVETRGGLWISPELAMGQVRSASRVIDPSTRLMWAARDNGSDINWNDAKRYCETYRGGGYSDWRMPTVAELKSLCYSDATLKGITMTGGESPFVWSSETDCVTDPPVGECARIYMFSSIGCLDESLGKLAKNNLRTLPVRGPVTDR